MTDVIAASQSLPSTSFLDGLGSIALEGLRSRFIKDTATDRVLESAPSGSNKKLGVVPQTGSSFGLAWIAIGVGILVVLVVLLRR